MLAPAQRIQNSQSRRVAEQLEQTRRGVEDLHIQKTEYKDSPSIGSGQVTNVMNPNAGVRSG